MHCCVWLWRLAESLGTRLYTILAVADQDTGVTALSCHKSYQMDPSNGRGKSSLLNSDAS